MAEKEITKVGPIDPTKATSALTGIRVSPASTAGALGTSCTYNGVEYTDGSKICADGTYLYCDNGSWSPGGSC